MSTRTTSLAAMWIPRCPPERSCTRGSERPRPKAALASEVRIAAAAPAPTSTKSIARGDTAVYATATATARPAPTATSASRNTTLERATAVGEDQPALTTLILVIPHARTGREPPCPLLRVTRGAQR